MPAVERMTISIYEATRTFWLDSIGPLDLPRLSEFVHGIADAVGQVVYVAALDVDGRHLGEPVEAPPARGLPIRIGSQAVPTGRFEFGEDVVIWVSEIPETMCRILTGHFVEDYWLHWAVVTDARGVLEVAKNLRHHWADLELLADSVGPQRPLALGNWDPGGFLAGGVSSEVWGAAVSRLQEMGGEVETLDADRGS
ncbi:MAG: hypothetical protein ACE149_18835 [Armatimonadota bacterium]